MRPILFLEHDSKSHRNHQQATHRQLNIELKQSWHTCPKAIFQFFKGLSPRKRLLYKSSALAINKFPLVGRYALVLTFYLLLCDSHCPTSILSQKSGIESYPRTRHVLPPRLPHPSKPNTPRPALLSRIPSRWPGIYHLRLSTPQREKGKEGGFLVNSFGGRKR